MRYQSIVPAMKILGLMFVLCTMLESRALWAQTFTAVSSPSVSGIPIQPGYFVAPGQTVTTYFNNQAAPVSFGSGAIWQGPYDALAWFRYIPNVPGNGIPSGWVDGAGAMFSCDPSYGDSWYVYIAIVGMPTPYSVSGGTHCYPPSPGTVYHLAYHLVGPQNQPVLPPPPPVTFKNPGDGFTCNGDPCDTKTGLYYQTDTDLDVPDVLPIRLTRTYRTNDTASRVFGIGASHPYDQYMLRDDLCTAARIILPDGAYIHFTRTSGTNCLDSILQHTTTATAFYAATLAWDPAFQRYRLKFKDGTEWRFSEYGSLVAMLDRNGNALTLTRAAGNGLAGNLTKITTPNGRYLTLAYDTANRITQVADIIGRTITYTYDASGRLSTVTNPVNGVTSYTYDTSHRVLTVTEPNGNIHVTKPTMPTGAWRRRPRRTARRISLPIPWTAAGMCHRPM